MESIIFSLFEKPGKGMNNTQTRTQNESNLNAIYIAYIAEKWDHNEKGNENNPQDTKNHHNSLSFLIIQLINRSILTQQEPI